MKRGFTMIELAVVISVISILSIMFFANYNGAEGDFALNRSVHQLAQDMRDAQERTTATQSFKGAYQGGYGIFLTEGATSYVLFVDCNADGTYNQGALNCQDCTSGSCVPSSFTEEVDTLELESGVSIYTLAPETNGDLSVSFLPPDPSVTFSPDASEIIIQLAGQAAGGYGFKTIKANKAGLISVIQ